jgi:hypothetical protein
MSLAASFRLPSLLALHQWLLADNAPIFWATATGFAVATMLASRRGAADRWSHRYPAMHNSIGMGGSCSLSSSFECTGCPTNFVMGNWRYLAILVCGERTKVFQSPIPSRSLARHLLELSLASSMAYGPSPINGNEARPENRTYSLNNCQLWLVALRSPDPFALR